jgi:hypothetical protein
MDEYNKQLEGYFERLLPKTFEETESKLQTQEINRLKKENQELMDEIGVVKKRYHTILQFLREQGIEL